MNENLNGSEIAIIGMAGRFPGARDLDAYWRNLRDGVESIRALSDEDLARRGADPSALRDPAFVRAVAEIDGADLFDAAFFTMNPREAEITDPQHRVFLECAWEALERAGYAPDRAPGLVGVFAGATINTYLLLNLAANPDLVESIEPVQINIGNGGDFLTTRVSYKLNLKGPSHLVQSACSTSLVAVHVACQSLLHDECDMALAGGVSINLSMRNGYRYVEGGMASPDGRCRAFDASAQGTIFGSGAGVVVLKRLADALADGDAILAVIKGSAINNDGSLKVGYIAPSVDGQAEVIAEALSNAGVEAGTIDYVEAHGTGTPLGDPIEVQALTRAFRATTERSGFCALGSVKPNIGHLDAAAGVAGLIKTVLALQNKQIPPSLHFQDPNPNIDFASSPFYVNAALADWPERDRPRRAGVSAFGVGGTNAHVILEEAPPRSPAAPARPWQILTLSARSEAALDAATANLAEYLARSPDADLADIAYTLNVGRQAFGHRRALVCRDSSDARLILAGEDQQRALSAATDPSDRPVVFLFPGQGAQHAGMARELYESEPAFRSAIDRCADLLAPRLGLDLRALLYPPEGSGIRDQGSGGVRGPDRQTRPPTPDPRSLELDQTQYAQPALFAVEYALAQLWMSWGVRPAALIGHSIGEYVAATIAGVFALEDALALVAARGRMMQDLPPGAMLAVPLAEDELGYLLGPNLALAAVNGPSMCVVAGPLDAVAELEQRMEAEGVSCRRLATSHAFHSQMIDPIVEPFAARVGEVALRAPQIPFISNVSGTWISPDEATDPRYWADHLRATVRFGAGVEELLRDPARVLLEVGPGQTLSRMVRRQPRARAGQVVLASLPPRDDPQSQQAALLAAVGRLWLAGARIDWPGFHGPGRRRTPLPTYPFERQRYWVDPAARVARPQRRVAGKQPDLSDWFFTPTWRRADPPAPGPDEAQRWLVFAEADSLGAALARRLAQRGHAAISVAAGPEFARLGDDSYTIDPRRPEDYAALIRDLRERDRLPGVVAHLWSAAPGQDAPLDPARFEQIQQTGFYSLVRLAQALDAEGRPDPLRIVVVSSRLHDLTGDEPALPEQAALLGPCIVIPQEYPQIVCQAIDIAPPPRGSRREAALIDRIIGEAGAPAPDVMVAYRGERRWVRAFEPLAIGDVAKPQALREGGVYLVYGGLDGLGFELARELARGARARLIVAGGSDAHDDDEALRRVRELESAGATVLMVGGDDGARGVALAIERMGVIDGVVYAAGVVAEQAFATIQELDQDHCEALFRSKAYDLMQLADAIRGWSPDFCLVASSLASVLGGLGAAAYTSANLFMDAFAHQQNQAGDAPWISVNWDAWQLAGAHAQPFALNASEGVETFRRIVAARPADQVIVSTGDLAARVEQWVTREALRERAAPPADAPAERHPRPKLPNAYVAPETPDERAVAAIWQRALGIEQVGVQDNFFDLGGDSLVAIQVTQALKRELNIALPAVSLYEALTIRALLALHGGERAGSAPDPARAERNAAREEKMLRRKSYQERQRAESRQRRRS